MIATLALLFKCSNYLIMLSDYELDILNQSVVMIFMSGWLNAIV